MGVFHAEGTNCRLNLYAELVSIYSTLTWKQCPSQLMGSDEMFHLYLSLSYGHKIIISNIFGHQFPRFYLSRTHQSAFSNIIVV
jgi:hypothetical protein